MSTPKIPSIGIGEKSKPTRSHSPDAVTEQMRGTQPAHAPSRLEPGDYATDGMTLYEIIRIIENFGRRRGRWAFVRDCYTERELELSPDRYEEIRLIRHSNRPPTRVLEQPRHQG